MEDKTAGVEFPVRVLGIVRLLAGGVTCCWSDGYGERLAIVLVPCAAGVVDDLAGFVAWVGTVFVAGRDELFSVGGVEFAVLIPGCVRPLLLGAACC